eukprot:8776385-Prorocentrum_lima.AAC.1
MRSAGSHRLMTCVASVSVDQSYYLIDVWHALATREQVEGYVRDREPPQQSAPSAFATYPP